ncbi:uncharacterized protein LOC126744622 isoform X2 [Anthonomus grandis grandis]|uniref:uncharacterized protein LOC126744622 isoform X2 n=1 Tax=Anthonomus grandis grandis TaxID=2921223 RepID=UPI00216523D6|nr:uncharacterized protein LOC126744622 isoform X2 [Anthonomus grandis grandis]
MEGLDTASATVRNQDEFLKVFIKAYQNERILWDKNHPKYKSRQDREEAMHALLQKCIEYFPEADLDFVKTKIDNMRCVFRRERKKVLESKKNAKDDDEIYSPCLWYYYHLLFLVGEEVDDEEKGLREGKGRMHTWSKRDTTILIDLLKKYPDAYSSEYSGRVQRNKRTRAFKAIWEELKQQGIKHFDMLEVKNKVTTLRTQYRRECREREKNKGSKHVSRLWCYDLLLFLKDSWGSKKEEKDPDYPDDEDISDDDQFNETNDDTGNTEPLKKRTKIV